MNKLTLSFWLALSAASITVVQNANPLSYQLRTDLPLPTCPPDCPDSEKAAPSSHVRTDLPLPTCPPDCPDSE